MPKMKNFTGKTRLTDEISGIRRERVFSWNNTLHKWDGMKEKIWIKDEKGKEILYKDNEKGVLK